MGVLTCNRKDCGNVMCDRSSAQFGYICNDCFDELVKSGPHTNIEYFMNSPKRKKAFTVDPYDLYNEESPDQNHRWGE